MYTGVDRYQHMEVLIIKGLYKQHFGTILASHTLPGQTTFDVRTDTKVSNVVVRLAEEDLRERQ
jgi:hypothetical protein